MISKTICRDSSYEQYRMRVKLRLIPRLTVQLIVSFPASLFCHTYGKGKSRNEA